MRLTSTPTDLMLVTPEYLLQADPRLRVKTLAATERPNQAAWFGMHQDYSEGSVIDDTPPPEHEAGAACVRHLLAGHRGHYGCLEHAQITIGTAGFPHSVMQQARTHRIGVSFDTQSMRYTGNRMLRLERPGEDYDPHSFNISDLLYFRPVGVYADRHGKKYGYTEFDLDRDKEIASFAVDHYNQRILEGKAEEHSRGLLPFDFRQNFVVSFTLRSLMHFLDLRAKLDAQLEIRALSHLLMLEFEKWTPEIGAWYRANRLAKARLAP